jgi:hypothetical protein
LHVDESCFYEETTETRNKNLELIKSYAADLKLSLNIVSLEEFYNCSREDLRELVCLAGDRASCREDLVEILRNKVIKHYCEKNDFLKVLSGNSG